MLSKSKRLIPLLGLIISLSGCESIQPTTTVAIHYAPAYTLARSAQKAVRSKTIELGVINDLRGIEDPKLLMAKTDQQTGEPVGKYVTADNVTSILRKAIAATLQHDHYKVVKHNAQYVLTGNLLGLDLNWQNDVVGGKLQGQLHLELLLTDEHTSEQVWRQTLTAKVADSTLTSGGGDTIRRVVEAAMRDALKQLAQSKSLAKAMRS